MEVMWLPRSNSAPPPAGSVRKEWGVAGSAM